MEADWEWPEETGRSAYYIPNRVETGEQPAPTPQPKLLKKTAVKAPDYAGQVTQLKEFSWVDEGLYVKVYLSVPGVVKDKVTCDIADDHVELVATGTPTGTYKLSLRRLYDRIHVPKSFHKVQESKNRVILFLCKPPPAHAHDEVKEWTCLQFNGESLPFQEFPSGRQKKTNDMSAMMPELPKETKRRDV